MLLLCRWLLLGLLIASPLVFTRSASAVSLTVGFEGGPLVTLDETTLGCGAAGSLGEQTCTGSDFVSASGMWTLQSWNLFTDPDPVIQNSFSVVNSSGVTQSFVTTVSLPVSVSFGSPSLIRGSLGGSATDLNGDGVTLGTSGTNPLYDAMIDGASVRTLLSSPFTTTNANPFGTTILGPSQFGIPSQESVGVGTTSDIELTLRFQLSAGDSAALSGVFNVEPSPVPEPSIVLLLGVGLAGLTFTKRRR